VLTEQTVGEIRKALREGVLQRVIAAQYGVSPSTIAMLNTGRIWRKENDK
jgi:IS30 family transposase